MACDPGPACDCLQAEPDFDSPTASTISSKPFNASTIARTRIALSLEQFLKSLPVLKEGGVRAACLVIYLPDEQREDLRKKMPNGSLAELKHALKVDGFPESNWVATWRGDEIVLRHVPS